MRIEKTYRVRTIKDGKHEDSPPVMAATIKDAMKLLGTRNMSNIQVMENGAWVWVA